MRSFSELSEADKLVRVGPRPLGEEWWRPGGDLGQTVHHLADPAVAIAYAGLHEDAHLWIHRDYEHDAWHVLDVDEPREVGRDFVAMARRPGVAMRMFYPDLTDDPAPAPADRLAMLHDVVEKLRGAAGNEIDRFIAELVAARVRARDEHVVYDARELRFYIDDLAPSPAELAAWRAVTRSPAALASFPLTWEPTGDADAPFRARIAGRDVTLRGRSEPYTLLDGADPLGELDAWPAAWDRP